MSQQSQAREALVSVRIVVMDHYMAPPLPTLDPVIADFRGYTVRKVPILRIFGSTPTGQKCCLHLHGIFPYMYVPMPAREDDGFMYRLASSLDKAINISMQQGKSNVQHVYKAVKVSGRPMYGYHPRQHNFIKLFFYNPFMVKRAADLLVAGAVMNRILQPHESHINFELQFMMDYNLQGMNPIHLRQCLFRRGQLTDEYDEVEPFFPRSKATTQPPLSSPGDMFIDSPEKSQTREDGTNYLALAPDKRFFRPEDMPDSLKMPPDVVRQSTTELELDAVSPDILNTNTLGEGGKGGMNPGLTALWEDERERRRQLDIPDPLTPPGSPPRPDKAGESSESELFWYERYLQVVAEKKGLVGRASLPDSQDPDATINMFAEDKRVYPVQTSEGELNNLPQATQPASHVTSLSESVGDLSLSVSRDLTSYLDITLDQTVVDEEVIASQVVMDGADEELIDILADLAGEAADDEENSESDMFSQNSAGVSMKEMPASSRKVSVESAEEEPKEPEEDEETLEMSQVVWDTDPNSREMGKENDWAEHDKTMMEDLFKDYDDSSNDMEDMFKQKE